jgi:glycosyl transferase family 25
MKNISDIKHAFYINLTSRPDRKVHVEKQLSQLGIMAERFNAIQLQNGAIGCSMSHLKCLETAQKNKWDHVLIVEDDILFTNPKVFIEQLNSFLTNHFEFDVVLLAGNNIPPYTKIDNSCIKVHNCQTTTGYLVKSHYFETLIQNYKEGIQHLLKEPGNRFYYAIDKYWFRLQERDKWYLITPLTVVQREDYSNIEDKITNYTNCMVDLDKPWLVQNRINAQKYNSLQKMNTVNKASQKISMII